MLYHDVTIGARGYDLGKRHPTLKNDVIVGAGAVVVNDIPDGVVVAGVPAKVIINKITPSHVFNNIK